MNLVPTFSPPPPVAFWRMSYFDKIKMRIEFEAKGSDKPSSIVPKPRSRNVATSDQIGQSEQARSGDTFSMFGDKLHYDTTASTSTQLNREPSNPKSHNEPAESATTTSGRNSKGLSNLLDDTRKPEANKKKRKDVDRAPSSASISSIFQADNTRNSSGGIQAGSSSGYNSSSSSSSRPLPHSSSSNSTSSGSSFFDSISNNFNDKNRSNSDNHNSTSSSNKDNSRQPPSSTANKTTSKPPDIPTEKNEKKRKSVPKDSEPSLKPPPVNQNPPVAPHTSHGSYASHGGKFIISDFVGIGSFCQNAGSTKEGLDAFVRKACSTDAFAVSVMWSSRAVSPVLSSNHATTTVKYCTPSVPCHTWYCSCDRHIRVQQAFDPLLGALILFPDEPQYLYFLPLAKCINPSQSNNNNSNNTNNSGNSGDNNHGSTSNINYKESDGCIPLNCQTSLEERWISFLDILLNKNTEKVIYNFQLALLPILAASYGLREDILIKENFIGQLTLIENVFDPRIAAYVCETDIPESEFEFLALCNRFNISLPAIQCKELGRVTVSVAHCYSELKGLLLLRGALQGEIEKRDGCLKVFQMLEMPLVALLSLMELRGVEISQRVLSDISSNIDSKIASIIVTAHELVGQAFNLASPEQVANILYEKLKLPTTHTSSKGRHSSTSEEDLLKIRGLHPVVDMVLNFRALSKVSTTYIAGLRPFLLPQHTRPPLQALTEVSLTGSTHGSTHASTPNTSIVPLPSIFDVLGKKPQTDKMDKSDSNKARKGKETKVRVHANWMQTTVRTGRLSCCRPNLQNIPNNQTVADIEIVVRKAFKASEGCMLVAADYSQIEMRVLAELCQDKKMMALFTGSGDIYRAMAAQIMGKQSPHAVTQEERNKAKVICLGTIYGMGPALAAAKLGIDVASANRITRAFFDNFRQMKAWMTKIKEEARFNGFVKTIVGRRRYLPDIKSQDPVKRAQAERQAINSVVQGSASDIIKLAMLGVESAMNQLGEDVRDDCLGDPQLLMQIHDELIYEIGKGEGACSLFQSGESAGSSSGASGLVDSYRDNNGQGSSSNNGAYGNYGGNANNGGSNIQGQNVTGSFFDTDTNYNSNNNNNSNNSTGKFNYNNDGTRNNNTNNSNVITPNQSNLPPTESGSDPIQSRLLDQLDQFQGLLQRCMGAEVMSTLGFSVPLTVTIKYGPDWGNMTELQL